MPDDQHHYRFESGPIVKIFVGLLIAGVVALAVLAFVTGSGLAIGILIALAVTWGIGLVLERVDSSRRREQGSDGKRDEHWGFHGRPGA